MLFDRNVEPGCNYCRYGTSIGQDEIACLKRGIVLAWDSCVMFRYEPTKRMPEAMPRIDISGLSEEDFSLAADGD